MSVSTSSPKKGVNKSLLYKIISSITLILPTSIVLVVSAIFGKPTADVNMLINGTINNDYVLVRKVPNSLLRKDNYFIYYQQEQNQTFLDETFKVIDIENFEWAEPQQYVQTSANGIYIKQDMIIRIIDESGFDETYNLTDKVDETNQFYTLEKVGIINIESGNKLSIAFIVSIISACIVIMVISGKMRLYRKYPRLMTFISLLTITIVLWVVNMIIGNILNVFLVATISWGTYCLEYYYFNKLGSNEEEEKAKKTKNDLLRALQDLDDKL